MKTYYGNYLGMVVTGGEKDPEGRGRCQIFIPHIMPALYEGWNKEGEDISFDIVGEGLPTALKPEIVETLKKILPWAECAAPMVGASPSTKNGSETERNTSRVVSQVAGLAFVQNLDLNAQGGGDGGQITEIPGTNRRLPLSSGLKNAISTALAGTGVNWKSTSGGQWPVGVIDPETGRQGSRVGKTKNHDLGNASDGQFIDIETGDPIDATTPAGRAKIASLLPRLRQAGIKGVGWDDVGYMGPLKWHLDISNPTPWPNNVWGAKAKAINGADWVKAALNPASQSPPSVNHSAVNPNVGLSTDQPGKEQKDFLTKGQKFIAEGTGSNGGVRLNYEGTSLAFVRSGRGVGQSATSFRFKNGTYLDGNSDIFVVAPTTDNTGKGIPSLMEKYPLGSKVVVTNPNTNKTVVGIIGDYGAQSRGWGEVSAAAARAVGIKEQITKQGLGVVGGSPENAKLEISVLPERIGRNGSITRDELNTFIENNNTSDSLVAAQTTTSDFSPELAAARNQKAIMYPTEDAGSYGPNTNYQALGMFGYASEGTAVWTFFRDGNPLFPVYFAASYGQKEWQNMYQHSSQGIGCGDGGALPGTEKMRFNSYGGGFDSTQVMENPELGLEPDYAFQVFGKNGSNLLFTADHTEFNSVYNHNQRVSGDFHEITEANKEQRVRGDSNSYLEQDVYVTVGNWSDEAIAASDEIQEYLNEAMRIKSGKGSAQQQTTYNPTQSLANVQQAASKAANAVIDTAQRFTSKRT